MSPIAETLLRLCAQTLILSALFIAGGRALVPLLLPTGRSRSLSFTYGSGFFIGVSLFQILFVFLSRAAGARVGLWLSIALLMVLAFKLRPSPRRLSEHLSCGATFLALAALFVTTDATYWLTPTAGVDLWTGMGSIHTGRYANYAIYIGLRNRVPHVAQDMGQSLMGSWHLLLGLGSPLASVASWIPVSLAALACLIFGVLRDDGVSRAYATIGAYFVLACNIAFSLDAHFVLDNGSPLAALGYTDAVIAVATFLLASIWFREVLVSGERPLLGIAGLPLLMAFVWTWSAPEDVIVAAAAVTITFVAWTRSTGFRPLFRRLLPAAIALVAGTAVAATQLGPLLPASLREDIGVEVVDVGLHLRLRPYVSYILQHWTRAKGFPDVPSGTSVGWMGPTLLYERAYEEGAQFGKAYVVTSVLHILETQVWESVRVYGFLWLGIVLLGVRIRALSTTDSVSRERLRAWFWIALGSFVIAYAIVFPFELNGVKWWLTRFLLPATGVCLLGVILAILPVDGKPTRRQAAALAVLTCVATVGPVVELVRTFYGSFIEAPLGTRLDLLVRSRGPFWQ